MTDVVVRALSPTQAATRRRLVDAALALASEGGYDAVGMRQVAARAGVTPPTAYQYFSSKDHLLVDAMVELVAQVTAAVESEPRPKGKRVADRAAATLRRVVRDVEQSPALVIALTRAFISGSREVGHLRPGLDASMRRWIEVALDDVTLDDPEAVVDVLQAVLFGNMVGLVSGAKTPQEVGDSLEQAVRLILRD
jgi:TetR/AcrR family transcriptional regulator, cholesterol catabolism regulator